MSEPYDRDKDPTLMGGNGGYGGPMPPQLTPEQDAEQRARMWKKAYEMEYQEKIDLRTELAAVRHEITRIKNIPTLCDDCPAKMIRSKP